SAARRARGPSLPPSWLVTGPLPAAPSGDEELSDTPRITATRNRTVTTTIFSSRPMEVVWARTQPALAAFPPESLARGGARGDRGSLQGCAAVLGVLVERSAVRDFAQCAYEAKTLGSVQELFHKILCCWTAPTPDRV